MPWEVVETHEGYQVVKAPALGEQPPKYFAQFSCSTVHRTPFRLTLEQAAGEGKIVSDQIKRRHEQDAAFSWKARAAPNNPSAPTGSTAQQCGFVSLGTCYHGGLPRRCIQLGQCLGSGGFADVFQGTVLALGGMQISSAQQYQQVMAAAAGQPGSVSVAVKVFRSSSSSSKSETLQRCAARELEALRHLQFKTQAVQLLAEGQPVPPLTTSIASQPDGSMPSPGCSKRKRKFGKDPCSLQLPYCAVLELCGRSLHEELQRGRCSEPDALVVAEQLVELLDYCQCGKLGCIIVHRDLKPANILLRFNGSVAVADFGACAIIKLSAAEVAKAAPPVAADEGSQQPAAPAPVWPDPAVVAAAVAAPIRTCIGTPFYVAPEVYSAAAVAAAPHVGKAAAAAAPGASDGDGAEGSCPKEDAGSGSSSSNNKRSYDASVDVFALGVIVVEMLLGSLRGLCEHGAPKSHAQAQQWEQRLQELVNGEMLLPEGVVLSDAALQFIGCCCGVGRERVAAAARGEPKRLTPAQLKKTAWMQRRG